MKNIIINTPKGIRKIGPDNPIFIVAEMSANHNKSFKRALQIIDKAAEAGADAIKLQTLNPDEITLNCDNKYFKVEVNKDWRGQTLYELYKKAHTPWEWHPKLKAYAEKKGLVLFSTPFDNKAVDFLEDMKVPLYKVASFETGDLELLKKIGSTKKPVIISRGMTSIRDLTLAVKTLMKAGAKAVAVLHCVSSYPAMPEQMNLATIPDIRKRFNVITGLSDHTLGISTAVTSVVLGASIIEKHLTLSRTDGGLDASFSLEPDEFKQMVQSVRDAEKAIGKPTYLVGKKESENVAFRRSLFVVKDIKKGDKFSNDNVKSIRPGDGLEPKHLKGVIGRVASRDIKKGTPISLKLIEN